MSGLAPDEAAVLSAMAYVDLNPIRAGITDSLEGSRHTSIVKRIEAVAADHTGSEASNGDKHEPGASSQAGRAPLTAVLGLSGSLVAAISSREYIQLVDLAGRDWHPGKQGRIGGPAPAVLGKLGIESDRWIDHVKAVKPKHGFWRAIGSEDALIAKAAAMGQPWLRGLNLARSLQR